MKWANVIDPKLPILRLIPRRSCNVAQKQFLLCIKSINVILTNDFIDGYINKNAEKLNGK